MFAHAVFFAVNDLGPEGVRAISRALERNTTLKTLDLGREFACCASILPMWPVSAACQCCCTRLLYAHYPPLPPSSFLDDHTIGFDGARAIGDMLQRNSTLLTLSLVCKQPPFVVASSTLCLECTPTATRNACDFVLQTVSKIQQKKFSWCWTGSIATLHSQT